LAESEKIKLVLSANKEATVFVEGIMDGIDFSATMTRRQFEKLAEETLSAVTSPLKRFLFDHDLRAEDLNAVELIGGGSRIPRLHALLGEALGNTSLIGAHINGDESMVLGAAFHGANSSKKFKVKGINLYDGFNFEMRIVLRNSEEGIAEDDSRYFFKNVTLFKRKSRYGLTKEVSFKCKENLIVEIYK
jgi:hypoxia up-regulated 1